MVEKYCQVADRLFVGNENITMPLLTTLGVDAIINLTGEPMVFLDSPDMYCADYVLGRPRELMPNEIPKIITKLKNISAEIKNLHDQGFTIMLYTTCTNTSMLVAGHYLITKLSKQSQTVVGELSCVYFTPEQREAENVAQSRDSPDIGSDAAERSAARCLTLASYRKILLKYTS